MRRWGTRTLSGAASIRLFWPLRPFSNCTASRRTSKSFTRIAGTNFRHRRATRLTNFRTNICADPELYGQLACPSFTIRRLWAMDVKDTFYNLVENVCRELYIRSLKEIPPDIVSAIRRAAATETREVAKRIFSHY